MGIKATFTQAEIERELQKRAMRIETAIIRRLQFLGEKCLIECRTNKTYMDQTGNLTSSMGYLIVANGRILDVKGFNQSLVGSRGTAYNNEGSGRGESLAKEAAAKYSSGYALIVVAGMEYAAYVESRGYNVLSSAELLAERELPKMIKALHVNIGKMK